MKNITEYFNEGKLVATQAMPTSDITLTGLSNEEYNLICNLVGMMANNQIDGDFRTEETKDEDPKVIQNSMVKLAKKLLNRLEDAFN